MKAVTLAVTTLIMAASLQLHAKTKLEAEFEMRALDLAAKAVKNEQITTQNTLNNFVNQIVSLISQDTKQLAVEMDNLKPESLVQNSVEDLWIRTTTIVRFKNDMICKIFVINNVTPGVNSAQCITMTDLKNYSFKFEGRNLQIDSKR